MTTGFGDYKLDLGDSFRRVSGRAREEDADEYCIPI